MIQSLAHRWYLGARLGKSLQVLLQRLKWRLVTQDGALVVYCTKLIPPPESWRETGLCCSHLWKPFKCLGNFISGEKGKLTKGFQLGLCSGKAMGRPYLSHQPSDPHMTGFRHLERLPFSGCFPSDIPS